MKELNISYRNLTVINDDLTGVTNLYCERNQLTQLPNLPETLILLDCSDNQLTSLPILPDTLVILYCYRNKLKMIPNLPKTLKRLDCDGNPLVKLPTLHEGLEHLICDPHMILSTILPYSLETVNEKYATKYQLQQYNDRLQQLGMSPVVEFPDYKTWRKIMGQKIYADRIDDITIAFRNSGLPPYIVTQIINEELQVPAWTLYDIQQHVRPILYRDEVTDTDYENNLVDLTTGKLKPIPLPQLSNN